MKSLQNLLEFNKSWAERIQSQQPEFFEELSREQHPNYLWIGCSDSRVPETQIVKQHPGDIFVHRNIANLVLHSDMNSQSVLQYAVQVLKVEHVIVCGHYGCGGIKAAMGQEKFGLIDNWLRNIKELYQMNSSYIDSLSTEEEKVNLLSELNVQQQVHHVCENPFVQSEWADGRELWIHGWVYDMETGLIKDLEVTVGKDNKG